MKHDILLRLKTYINQVTDDENLKEQIKNKIINFEELIGESSNLDKKDENKYKGFIILNKIEENEDIEISVKGSELNIPKLNKELYIEIEKMKSNIIKIFEKDVVKKKKYLEMLFDLSVVGLGYGEAKPLLGFDALKLLKNEIYTVESGLYKNKYLLGFGKRIFFLSIILIIIMMIFRKNPYNNYLLILIGSFLGNWVSIAVRKIEITFDDLINFEEDQMSYYIKLVFIGLVSIVFSALINLKIIVISINNINLTSFFGDIVTTIVLGFLLGLLDNKLAINLYEKSSEIISNKGG